VTLIVVTGFSPELISLLNRYHLTANTLRQIIILLIIFLWKKMLVSTIFFVNFIPLPALHITNICHFKIALYEKTGVLINVRHVADHFFVCK
jgi:hypothetical protein